VNITASDLTVPIGDGGDWVGMGMLAVGTRWDGKSNVGIGCDGIKSFTLSFSSEYTIIARIGLSK